MVRLAEGFFIGMVRQAQDRDLIAAVLVVSYARAGNDGRKPREPLELRKWSLVHPEDEVKYATSATRWLNFLPFDPRQKSQWRQVVSSPTRTRTNVHETRVRSGFRSRSDQNQAWTVQRRARLACPSDFDSLGWSPACAEPGL